MLTFEKHRYWYSYNNRVVPALAGLEEDALDIAECERCNVAVLDEEYRPHAYATFDPATGKATYKIVSP